jgi:hypothetical protein
MKDLLTRALDAHGGLSRWREIEAFQLKVSIGSGLWRLKGLPDGLRDVTLHFRAATHERRLLWYTVEPMVERTYTLEEAAEVLRYLIEDRPFGSVVVAG